MSATPPAKSHANPPVGVSTSPSAAQEKKTMAQIFTKAGKQALGGGIPGAAAMACQVVGLMWIRTTMNYQYRYGTSTSQAFRTLYSQGGVPRFYRGLGAALFQAPLSRFGDTAANAGVLSVFEQAPSLQGVPTVFRSMTASLAAASFRIALMPIDAVKTIMQVEGANGFQKLQAKIRTGGVGVLYHGSLGAATATWVGHFPFFGTYNELQKRIPKAAPGETGKKLARNALIGFVSSVVSDTISNSLRVIKTTKQTSTTIISYPAAVRMVLDADGVAGLFGRGLQTRIIANGIQGMLFSVLWKFFEEQYATPKNKEFKAPSNKIDKN